MTGAVVPAMSGYYPINGIELKEYMMASLWKVLEGHPDLTLNSVFRRVKWKISIEFHMEPKETSQPHVVAAGEQGNPSIPDKALAKNTADLEGEIGYKTSPEQIRKELQELRASDPLPAGDSAAAADSPYAERLRSYLRPKSKS